MKVEEREIINQLEKKGYGIIPPEQFRIDIEEGFRQIWSKVSGYTMTSLERGYALYQAVRYIVEAGIDGDFVECGVWKGGSCMLIAFALIDAGCTDRKIYLYDTFDGMTEPGGNDFIAWNGKSVRDKWNSDRIGSTDNFTGWSVGLEAVKNNIRLTAYPEENIVYVKGPVEQTLQDTRPELISLLRLDTDWYESTKIELEYLYPLLSRYGALIIDDYGHFTGAKKAVDEYLRSLSLSILLNRIDYTGRIGIKS